MDKLFGLPGVAVLLGAATLVPQILSVFKTKSVEGVNPTFLTFNIVASIIWIIHNKRIGDQFSVISSYATLILNALVAIGYYMYKNRPFEQRQQMEDERFQYGGPAMTRGEPRLAMPGSHHFAGASDSYRGSPDQGGDYYDENYAPQEDPADYGGGLFGGKMMSTSMDFSDG